MTSREKSNKVTASRDDKSGGLCLGARRTAGPSAALGMTNLRFGFPWSVVADKGADRNMLRDDLATCSLDGAEMHC